MSGFEVHGFNWILSIYPKRYQTWCNKWIS